MEWLRTHPYIPLLALVVVLVVGGTALITSRQPVPVSANTITWSGGAGASPYQYGQYTPSVQNSSPEQIAQDVIGSETQPSLTLPQLSTATTTSIVTQSTSPNYVQLLEQLGSPSTNAAPANTQTSANALIARAYQFIPTGLVATITPATKMTSEQQAIYDYGNQVGGEIQSFEQLHTNEPQVLKDQVEDRTNAAKAQAVVSLGQGLAAIGTYMEGIQDVPSSAQSLNTALGQSYIDIGTKLQLIPAAQSDSSYVQAVENYDDSANTFVHNYAQLAEFFTNQGVVFSTGDPGSVFSFNDSGGAGGL